MGPSAQVVLTTRRSSISPPQAKLDQRPNTSRHSSISRSASRAPSGPRAARSRSQPKPCSASAKARLGLGRFHGSPLSPTDRLSPAKVKTPASSARPLSARAGRKSFGKIGKPWALGPFRRARCGGEPNHSVRPCRAMATRAASSQS